ncbi:MAG: GntR family transcriptional regulator [Shinella sp.]|nr:GntR family transcriptional regulator [Shinella sp.]
MEGEGKYENTGPRKRWRREAIYERLKSDVVNFRALPGQRLSIAHLSASFRSSNTPVREALIQLSAERLVDPGPAGGFAVRNFRLIEMQELLHLSRLLLTNCIRNASHCFESDCILRPSALGFQSRYRATRVLRTKPEETAIFIESIFHGIAKMSGNNEIANIIGNICDRTHHIRAWHVRETAGGRTLADQLVALLDGLERDDRAASMFWLDNLLEQQIDHLPRIASKALAEMLLNTES